MTPGGFRLRRAGRDGKLLADASRTYTWDAENQLVGVAGNGYSSTFSYDGLGRRTAIATTSGGVTGSMRYGFGQK